MTKFLIYESPKRDNPKGHPHRSAPIREDDETSRRVLEGKGWRIVETRDEQPVPEPAPLLPVGRSDDLLTDGAALVFDDATTQQLPPLRGQLFTESLTEEQANSLERAGYGNVNAIRNATDAQLREVDGITAGVVRKLRADLKTAPETTDGTQD